jgi:hypothetical protein
MGPRVRNGKVGFTVKRCTRSRADASLRKDDIDFRSVSPTKVANEKICSDQWPRYEGAMEADKIEAFESSSEYYIMKISE